MNFKELETYTAKPLVPEPRFNEDVVITEKLEHYKSLGINFISAELLQAGSKKYSEIYKLSLYLE